MKPSTLSLFRRLVFAALAGIAAVLATGCTTTNPDESVMPWTRQQEWENQGPGLPGNR